MFVSNLRRVDPTFGQPLAEVGNPADLQHRRVLGIAFCAQFGRLGINVLTQRPLRHAQQGLGIREKQVHRCSPLQNSVLGKHRSDYAGKIYTPQLIAGQKPISPGIVRRPE